VIDSQSVRAADTVARTSRGWDNAKKVNGRKRHRAGRLQDGIRTWQGGNHGRFLS
jgi:hypothetical protein